VRDMNVAIPSMAWNVLQYFCLDNQAGPSRGSDRRGLQSGLTRPPAPCRRDTSFFRVAHAKAPPALQVACGASLSTIWAWVDSNYRPHAYQEAGPMAPIPASCRVFRRLPHDLNGSRAGASSPPRLEVAPGVAPNTSWLRGTPPWPSYLLLVRAVMFIYHDMFTKK